MLGIDIVLLNLKLSRYQIYALRFLFLFPCFPTFYYLCTSTSVHILFPLCKKWCECLNIIEYAMCETSWVGVHSYLPMPVMALIMSHYQ